MGELPATAAAREFLLTYGRFKLMSCDAALADGGPVGFQQQVVKSRILLWRRLATYDWITRQEVLKSLLEAVQKTQVTWLLDLGVGEQHHFWSLYFRRRLRTRGRLLPFPK